MGKSVGRGTLHGLPPGALAALLAAVACSSSPLPGGSTGGSGTGGSGTGGNGTGGATCPPPPTNTSTIPFNRCPTIGLCPECTQPTLMDGVYFQVKGAAVLGSGCGSCQPRGTLRLSAGVFDLVSDELSDVCVGGEHIHVHGAFTVSGDTLHVSDDCSGGALDWSFGSSDMGMLKLIPIAESGDAGTGSRDWDYFLFQQQ